MRKRVRIVWAAAMALSYGAPVDAQWVPPHAGRPPAITARPVAPGAPAATAKGADPDSVVVIGRPRRRGVMRLVFGQHRRRGGFLANLLHPRRHWRTFGHRKHCKRRYRSYNPRTDTYHAYSGAVRKCVL